MADEIVENNEETAAGAAEEAAAEETVVATTDAAGEAGSPEASGDAAGASGAEEDSAGAGAAGEESVAAAMAGVPAREIKPDIKFVKAVIAAGGTDLKKCFQCANCSVVCNITPEDHPFPRKEMIWAQWGLKDKLTGDPDIWLCHQCNDCTAQCPRDAKPGRVMQAIAKMTIPSLSKPSFLANGIGNPSALLIMAAIPVIILALTIGLFGHFDAPRGEVVGGVVHHEGEIVYGSFLGHWPIVGVFTTFFMLSVIIFALGVKNYWGKMTAHARAEGRQANGSGLAQLGPVLSQIAAHKRFGKCDETKDRKTSHMFIFYSFLLLFGATALSTVLTDGPMLWGGEGILSPYGDFHPVKWFGYSGAIAGLIGIGLITINRFKHQEKVGKGSYFDWLLIGLIMAIMVTGVASVAFRKMNAGVLAYPTYFVHLSAVLFLFMYMPFSKMAHMVYRTTAMAFARATGRDTPM